MTSEAIRHETLPVLPEDAPAGEWELFVLGKDDDGEDILALRYRGTGDNKFLVHESVAGHLEEVGKFHLHPKNPRRGDVPKIRGSVKYHGQFDEIIVNRGTYSKRYPPNTIGAGNHTYKSILEEGWTHVGVSWVDVSDDELDRIMLVHNASSDAAYYDEEVLAKVLQGMGDVDGTGYAPEFVERLLIDLGTSEPEGLADPDEVVEPPEVSVTRPGDLWLLGPHRVLCGESKNDEDLARLLAGATPSMVFTDPPYGVDYVSRVDEERRKPWGAIANDHLKGEALRDLLRLTLGGFSCPMYACCNWQSVVDFVLALGKPNSMIVWDKGSMGLGTGYRNQHEFVLFYGKLGRNDESNVWRLPRDPNAAYDHPTQKPVGLAGRAIANSSPRGGLVLDLFAGSGSTLIAAHGRGRACYAMELKPAYVDVICRRFQRYTGIRPVLEATGQPHDFAAEAA